MNTIKNSKQGTTFSSNSKTTKSKWWLWLILAVIVIIAIIFIVKKCSLDKVSVPPPAKETESVQQAKVLPESETAISDEQQTTADETTVSTQSSNQPTVEPATNNTSSSILPQGTIEEKAKRVIRGDFGNGAKRKQKLEAEYNEIQTRVNKKIRNGDIYW
jgi:cytoskeletal protein RodZ